MTNDYLPLDFDDLVHIMSPSPAPPPATLDDLPLPLRPRSTSPEPQNDVSTQENRMNITATQDFNGSVNEPADMQTITLSPDPEQIIRQAEIISCLIEQRDMLVQQADEQRLRWNSEKDGWARMAEALIAQQAKHKDAADKDDDLERQHALAEADNRSLRQRLHETQSRLSILEGELSHLRPLLLMQPLALNEPVAQTQTPRARQHRRRRKDANTHMLTTEDEDPGPDDSEDDRLADPEDTPIPAQTTPKQKSHATSLHPHPHKRRHSQKCAPRVLTADARTEHLLLAAKRIGKQRVGIMAGLTQTLDRRQDELTSTVVVTPKTPKRTAAIPPGPGYVYLNSPMRPGAVPVLIPAYPHHMLQTPSSSKTAASASSSTQQKKQQQGGRNQNPPTPLDSLLSAARSMMHNDEDDDETLTGTRRSRSSDVPDSPIPKRRKVAPWNKINALRDRAIDQVSAQPSSSSVPAGSSSTAAVSRVRSGLDVLADQAAAFSSHDHLEPQSRTKGKGKEMAPTHLDKSPAQPLREKSKSKRKQSVPDDIPERPRSLRPAPLPRATTVTDWGAGPPSLRPVQWTEGPAQVSSGNSSTREVASASLPLNPPTPPAEPTDQAMQDIPSSVAAPSPMSPAEPSPVPSVDAPSGQSISNDPFIVPPNPPDESSLAMETIAPSSALHQRAATTPISSSLGDTPLDSQAHLRHGTAPGSTNAGRANSVADSTGSGSGPATGSVAIMKNKGVTRVADQDAPKRQRSPYVKWSKEEDDLLAQAVAKYGQKWDLVQKALPSRGYHQVRQRWLRKLGVFDSKPDLSSFQTGFSSGSHLGETPGSPTPAEPPPNPKLGLAPLSSELAISSFLSGRGESRPS